MGERIVTCVRWGARYGAQYVNAVYRGVARHLSGAFRFVALTESAQDLVPGIEVADLGALRGELPHERLSHGKWQKLVMFRRGVFPDDAAVLYLDLDTVIVGDLAPLFERIEAGGGHHLCRHDAPAKPGAPLHRFGNSSVIGFVPRQQAHVYDRFVVEGPPAPVRKEQEFQCVTAAEVRHWPRHWIANFKSDCARSFPASLLRKPRLPDGTRVVIFPGAIKPTDMVRGGLYVWGTPARFGIGNVGWIADYWRAGGGVAGGDAYHRPT